MTMSGAPWVETARKRTSSSVGLEIWWAPSAPRPKGAPPPRPERPPPRRRAQRRPPAEHEDELLVGVVEVVRVGGLAGRQFPHARPEPLAAELVPDAGAEALEAGRPVAFLEVRVEDVRHAPELKRRSVTSPGGPRFGSRLVVSGSMRPRLIVLLALLALGAALLAGCGGGSGETR